MYKALDLIEQIFAEYPSHAKQFHSFMQRPRME